MFAGLSSSPARFSESSDISKKASKTEQTLATELAFDVAIERKEDKFSLSVYILVRFIARHTMPWIHF